LCGGVAPPPAGTTIIFKSLGQAVEDTVAARLVYRAALAEVSFESQTTISALNTP
jgi:thiomorpholine-carboxylate dehydrogenase